MADVKNESEKMQKRGAKKTAVKQKMRKLRLAVKSFMIQQASKNYNRRKNESNCRSEF